MLTIDQAEKIRKKLDLNPYQFSQRISYSPTAYQYALLKGRISFRMAKEIKRRFATLLEDGK